MRDEYRDPVTDDPGTGSDEARLFVSGNGGPAADALTERAPGSRNRSEESVDTGDESDEEGGVEGVDEDEDEELDEEDDLEEADEEDEDLLDGEEEEALEDEDEDEEET